MVRAIVDNPKASDKNFVRLLAGQEYYYDGWRRAVTVKDVVAVRAALVAIYERFPLQLRELRRVHVR